MPRSRMLVGAPQAHRPPRQVKAGLPPGRGGSTDGKGQPPFVPTNEQRTKVMKLVACGFTRESISVIMAIPDATLDRHFAWELTHGKTMIDAKILGGIVDQAIDGDKTMSIFYAKARGGWREGRSGDDQAAPSAVFSINISNSRDNGASAPRHEVSVTAVHTLPEPEERCASEGSTPPGAGEERPVDEPSMLGLPTPTSAGG